MIEEWILNKIEPLKPTSPIILRDPQRILQNGAHVVDNWAAANGYSVFFCVGNLALREMLEASRDEPGMQILVVDPTRKEARVPLFYPDLLAQARKNAHLELDLRDYLIEQTGDPHWPTLVEDRELSRLILAHLPQTLLAHGHLRQVNPTRFSDSDLYKLVLGAVLSINPFKTLSSAEVRRLCIQQHDQLDELNRLLPATVMASLQKAIADAPAPFCWLLTRHPQLVVRAFTLAAILHQHKLDYRLLLSNIDPLLYDYRQIEPAFLQKAVEEQRKDDPERLLADVVDVERFLLGDQAKLTFLLRDQLKLDDRKGALAVLKQEHLSELIRSMAMLSLLIDLLQTRSVSYHEQVQELLAKQAEDTAYLALRRPSEKWRTLVDTHRQALVTLRLIVRSADYAKEFQVTPAEQLDFAKFHQLWNEDQLNRLDYYTSDLKRQLRVGDMLPVAIHSFWPELTKRWDAAHQELEQVFVAVGKVQALLNHRFQDLYLLHYAKWIQQADSPMVFTHQVLPRLLKANWDPQSGQKAVILVFDGLRTDAWDEYLRPVFEERFALLESRPGSALLPTETHLSRKAISAGCLPTSFSATSELKLLQNWLKQQLHLTPNFTTVKNDDTVAAGMTVRFSSPQLDYIVFNFSDKNLHNNTQELAFIYNTTLSEIIRQDVRSVLRELPDSVLLIITSDHGFTPVPTQDVQIPSKVLINQHDVKYRSARTLALLTGADAKQTVAFDAATLAIPTDSEGEKGKHFKHLLFPRPSVGFRRPQGRHDPDPYNHGGLSLAECMVPMVVMGPKPSAIPLLKLTDFSQRGGTREGEEVQLELVLNLGGTEGVAKTITINFSQADLAERRDFFPGKRTTYLVRWQPRLAEPTSEQREQGEVRLPLTVIVSYRDREQTVRLSRTTDVIIKLDTTRLRRRVDSKLNLLMGKVPKGLQG